MSTTQPLTLGVYHSYGTGSGDATNRDYDPTARTIRGEPSLTTDAQSRPGGGPDLRLQTKVDQVGIYTFGGLTSNLRLLIYTSPTAPIPIIRNEDLILLRAEANMMLGNTSAAIQDINVVRVNAGGLAPIPDPFGGSLTDELLYNRRYSLLFEGHRWIDMRRFARLGTLPREQPGGKIFYRYPIPQQECQPRTPTPPGCTSDPRI